MNKMLAAAATCAAISLAGATEAAQIAPVSVTASNTFSFFGEYRAGNLIDGSGLSAGLHDGNYAAMWMTDLEVASATLTFDLGQSYDLTGATLWNYNFDNGANFLNTLERGVRDFRVLLSDDGVTFGEAFAGTAEMAARNAATPGQQFGFGGTARYVRLDLLRNHSGDGAGPIGLSEVRFDVAAVPEPAAWALMIGGFGAIGGTLRGRARRATAA